MAELLKSKRTFRELGIVCLRAVRQPGKSAFKYTIWFRDGRVLKDIVA